MENAELAIKEGYILTQIGEIPACWNNRELFVKTMLLFLEKESFILENNLNERTISHKLAEYFQSAFSNYDVDCEYNRMRSKTVDEGYIAKALNLSLEASDACANETTVFPDIVVHKRGNNDDNYLIIEVKKKSYAEKRRSDKETYRDFDKRKLKAYIEHLKYKQGIYIEFDGSRISELYFHQMVEE